MTNLQIEHLVERWEDRRDVKNQMGKFMHYLLLKKEAAERQSRGKQPDTGRKRKGKQP